MATRLNPVESAQVLQAALQTLAARDTDRASTQNGIGFSQADGVLGHSLANQPAASWTARQYSAAYRIVRRYSRTQVAVNFDVLAIPGEDTNPREFSKGSSNTSSNTSPNTSSNTSPKISVRGDRIVITFRFDRAIIDTLKGMGGRYDPIATGNLKATTGESVWWLPLSRSGEVLAKVQDGTFVADTDTSATLANTVAGNTGNPIANAVRTVVANVTNAVDRIFGGEDARLFDLTTLPDPVCPNLREGAALRPFQVTGAKFLVHFRRALCADDMGVGKTLQSLGAADSINAYPLLVVCPAIVKGNWVSEVIKFFPTLTVTYLGGNPTWEIAGRIVRGDVLDSQVVIVNYDILTKYKDYLFGRKWAAIIADEAHYLKTRDTVRTQMFTHLATGYDAKNRVQTHPAIEYRWLLTGTPIMNRPSELISLITILDYLRTRFGGYTKFVNRYCDPKRSRYGTDITGATNLEELARELRAGIMIRRSKRDVLTELPSKSRVIAEIDISNRAEYVRAERDVVAFLSGIARDRADVIAQATSDGAASGLTGDDLEAYVNDARDRAARDAARRARSAEVLVAYNTLRQLAGKGKIDSVIEWITEFLTTGKKLVVFGTHTAVVSAIARKFNAPTIVGDTPLRDRTNIVERFQTDPDFKLLVCNTRAGGVGITLTAASDVLFTELEWNPAMHDQSEDRVNRMGQTEPCTAWYLLASKSIDGDMFNIINGKRDVSHAGLGDADHDRVESTMMESIFDGLMSRNR